MVLISTYSYLFVLTFNYVYGSKAPPPGHLRPLGYQSPPSMIIQEYNIETSPNPEEFFENHVKPSKPAIFRGGVKDTLAYKLWTDEYVRKHYGDLEVRLEGKKEMVHAAPLGEKYMGRDILRHFIDHYHEEESTAYVISQLPKQMYKDVGVVPSIGDCGEISKRFVHVLIWWSGGGSKSILHRDGFNQMNCLHNGTKHWKVFDKQNNKWLHKNWNSPEEELGGSSNIDVEAVDLLESPNITKVAWSNFTLHAGDCLFLPTGLYHQVDSDGPTNLAVSILFSSFEGRTSIDASDCTSNANNKVSRSLSEFNVMWQWEGKGAMSLDYGDLEDNFRVKLLVIADELAEVNEKITLDALVEHFGTGSPADGRLPLGNLEKAITLFDKDKNNEICREEIISATHEQLKNFALVVEPYEPSNHYEFEYSFVSFWLVFETVQEMIKKYVSFTRKQWIRTYIARCKGSEGFANEIFSGLVKSEQGMVVESRNIHLKDIMRALKHWIYYWTPQYSHIDIDPRNEEVYYKTLLERYQDEQNHHEEL